ncbi:sigma-70 family RNA polymerase sigma factor [Candidatus Kuenenbacteria bacterium]|nr:sigma-70 family RNA polymerase sigma factor [Candidatus Kuenenbacteria bacterium]
MKGLKIEQKQLNRLVEKIQKGDEESFGKIYDSYVDSIYRYVFLKIGSKEKTEEIAQDVFLKFWRFVREKENKVKNVNAFLYTIAKSLIADYYRAAEKREETVMLEETIITEADLVAGESLDEEIDIGLDMEKIKAVLGELPQIYQDVIIMKFMDELNNDEIALALDKEEGHIRVLAHRALKKLRELLLKKNG